MKKEFEEIEELVFYRKFEEANERLLKIKSQIFSEEEGLTFENMEFLSFLGENFYNPDKILNDFENSSKFSLN